MNLNTQTNINFHEFAKQFAEVKVKNNFYEPYLRVLQTTVEAGYNSTIVCPVMIGESKDWAMFLASIVNEIIDFTQIAKTPACLISGGPLDNLQSKNEEFAFQLFSNIRPVKDVSFVCCDSEGKGFKLKRPKISLEEYKRHEILDKKVLLQQIEMSRIDLKVKNQNSVNFELRAVFIN